MQFNYFDRDTSWLGFNHRVLMEAADNDVPLMERLKFLAIYSANLDEFYKVRMPTLTSLNKLEANGGNSYYSGVLTNIGNIINTQMKELGYILEEKLIPLLKEQKIHLVYNEPIPEFLQIECTEYFYNQVAAFLQPVILTDKKSALVIENNKLQLLVLLTNAANAEQLAIVNIPSDFLPRFYFKDDTGTGTRFIIFLDDIIKANLDKIFTGYTVNACYSFKITRDAALDLQDEYDGDIAAKIEQQLKKRDNGLATRFLYQPGISLRVLYALFNKLNLSNANAVPGGNYHNLKNLANLPVPENGHFFYNHRCPINKTGLAITPTIFDSIAGNDIIIHTPYQSFFPVVRFFNEAALDRSVEEIYLTIYRVADDSIIVNSLISAANNGKKVTVFVELKARFDEENNLKWASKLKDAGVKIIYSIPGLKVHAKVALVKRRENNRLRYYGLFSTGNFNEKTACLYTDHVLLTGHPGMVTELEKLFIFFGFRIQPKKYGPMYFEHLLVAQFNLQSKFLQLISQEIEFAKQGRNGAITIKLNSLEDKVLIAKLYEASNAGVQVRLLVRGICCLVPGVANMSENITVTRIVDRYLEHGRVFIFGNDGAPLVFMGSADWMNKSMYYRIEVVLPVYDQKIKAEMIRLIDIQLADNVKAVQLNEQLQNSRIAATDGQPLVQSQQAIYDLLNL